MNKINLLLKTTTLQLGRQPTSWRLSAKHSVL